MVHQKGLSDLITAFAMLTRSADRPRVQLLLLGDGPLEGDLRRQAQRQGVSGHVIFCGFRPDVVGLLPAIDVIAFSSLYEGLPIALLEAMAAGRCIVATDVPGIGDVLTNGDDALIVPAHTPSALCAALARVVTDSAARSRLGIGAYRRFSEQYTADRMVVAYERIYRELARAGQGSTAIPGSDSPDGRLASRP
jgi:glycosyltransferase involved in cell wall biosynthesis